MVGATGFEPATSCTPSKRASQAAPRPDGRGRGYRGHARAASIAGIREGPGAWRHAARERRMRWNGAAGANAVDHARLRPAPAPELAPRDDAGDARLGHVVVRPLRAPPGARARDPVRPARDDL